MALSHIHMPLSDANAPVSGVVKAETVRGLCQHRRLSEAVEALGVLVHTDCHVSASLLYAVLKGCVGKRDLALGRRVHALSVKKGYESDTFLCNHILRMYASQGRLQEAMDVFTTVARPDAFTWSAIISAHVRHGQDRQALELYDRMRRSRVAPDGHVFVAALQACARGADLESGQQVHADVLTSGLERDLFVRNCLIDMYAKCGSLKDAQRLFVGVGDRDVVTWNAMIAGYSQQGMGPNALRLYTVMRDEGIVKPNAVTFVCLLQACACVGAPALEEGKELHARINELGLQADVVVAGSLVNMYVKCGSLVDARGVFDGLGQKNVVTWSTMIAGYSQQGMGQEALQLHAIMQEEGIAAPDSGTFVCLLQACASVGTLALEMGKNLHSQIRKEGHETDVFVGSSLVSMYAKCGSLEDAQRVFDGLCQKDVVTWNAMISGYSQQGMGQEALRLYSIMQGDSKAVPNSVTSACLLQACACVGSPALEMGKQLHAHIKERGQQADLFVANSLVNMYAKCGGIEDAQRLFDGLGQKDIVTWNAMIAGYSQQGMGQDALHLYSVMQEAPGIALPNSMTFACLLHACASVGTPALEEGRQLHFQIRERRHDSDVFVANGLVNMYAKCGSLEDAEKVFEELVQKDVVTWTALIAGYSQQGMGQEALRLYSAMQEDGKTVPDSVTFVCLLQACANVAALHLGRQLHAQIEEQGLQAGAFVAHSLINMYAKCGSMVEAQEVFDALPRRDAVAWNGLIAGYSAQGDSKDVFESVVRMRDCGIQPDSITFLGILMVCSHTGQVNKGQEYFDAMSSHYGIAASVEHYTCMVDLLGRAGRLNEAKALISTMPVPPNAVVWHTLLAACSKWSNVEVGRHAFDESLKLDEKDAAAYVLMSNIYTSAQMGEQAQEMQARRKSIQAWKQAGQSWWTDMDGTVHYFLVGVRKSPSRLKLFRCKLNNAAYPQRLPSLACHIFDDIKQCHLRGLSQKLAETHALNDAVSL